MQKRSPKILLWESELAKLDTVVESMYILNLDMSSFYTIHGPGIKKLTPKQSATSNR